VTSGESGILQGCPPDWKPQDQRTDSPGPSVIAPPATTCDAAVRAVAARSIAIACLPADPCAPRDRRGIGQLHGCALRGVSAVLRMAVASSPIQRTAVGWIVGLPPESLKFRLVLDLYLISKPCAS